MDRDELEAVFDRMAPQYDMQWARMGPIRECLYFLVESVLAELPGEARVLCVGAGTGLEVSHLARRFPGWTFSVVEPSGPMLAICRQRAETEGIAARCRFHAGYLESLPATAEHDAATCFLVSQFILDRGERVAFFHAIAERLRPGGVLACADLASATASPDYEALLRAWLNMMAAAGVPAESLANLPDAFARDLAILPPHAVAATIEAGGFCRAVQFLQAGLIHAWFAGRV